MTIKYWVEGPKGSGKTTVLKHLMASTDRRISSKDQFSYHSNSKIHHFGGHDATLQGDVLQQLQVSSKNYFVDRGYLSSIIYGWLGSVEPEFKITKNFGQWSVTGWTQFEQNQFKLIVDHLKGNHGAYIVFYASNPASLASRIIDRGANMNSSEIQELLASNSLHEAYGKMLQNLYRDDYPIIVWDISASFISNLIDNQIVLSKFYDYETFSLFDWESVPLLLALKHNCTDQYVQDPTHPDPDDRENQLTKDVYQHYKEIEFYKQMEIDDQKANYRSAVDILKHFNGTEDD